MSQDAIAGTEPEPTIERKPDVVTVNTLLAELHATRAATWPATEVAPRRSTPPDSPTNALSREIQKRRCGVVPKATFTAISSAEKAWLATHSRTGAATAINAPP